MRHFKHIFANLLRDDHAATAVEYAVMMALILVAIISAIGAVGSQTGGMWGRIDSDIAAHGVGQ